MDKLNLTWNHLTTAAVLQLSSYFETQSWVERKSFATKSFVCNQASFVCANLHWRKKRRKELICRKISATKNFHLAGIELEHSFLCWKKNLVLCIEKRSSSRLIIVCPLYCVELPHCSAHLLISPSCLMDGWMVASAKGTKTLAKQSISEYNFNKRMRSFHYYIRLTMESNGLTH